MKRNMATSEDAPRAKAMGMPLKRNKMATQVTIHPIHNGYIRDSLTKSRQAFD
jgi:hypothetical protein